MAQISNLYIDQGAHYKATITAYSRSGVPLDLTDYVIKSQMRKSYGTSKAYTFDAYVLNGPAGRIRLILTSDQTELIPAGRYLYDVEVTSPGGTRKRVVEGVATVTPQITQI